jgi:hypothetical protein
LGALIVEFGDRLKNEEGGVKEDKNTPKDYNMLPKNPCEVGLRVAGHPHLAFSIIIIFI